MKAIFTIACSALLVSCAPADEGTLPGEPAERVEGEAPDLSGHYRIQALGSDPLPFALEVSANTNAIWWEPACSAQGLSYRPAADGKVEFFDLRDPNEPQIVCDIGYPEELTQLWERLAGTHDVSVREDRSMIVNVEGEPFLFEPTTDPLPTTLAGTWQVEMIDGFSTSESRTIRFIADGQEIWWDPRCAGIVMEYTLAGESFAITKPAETAPPPPSPEADGIGPPPPPPPVVCLIGLPTHLQDAASALRAAETVARDYQNNLVFRGDGRYIILSQVRE